MFVYLTQPDVSGFIHVIACVSIPFLWPANTLLCEYTTLFTDSSMTDIWVSYLLLYEQCSLLNIHVQIFI